MNSKGFSLVEMMVALVIGLMVSVSVIPMAISYGQSKKNNLAQDDMAGNAITAMAVLTAGVQNAGLGFINSQKVVCTSLDGVISIPEFSPLMITATPSGDSIMFAHAADSKASAVAKPTTSGQFSSFTTKNSGLFATGEHVLASTNNACTLGVVASAVQNGNDASRVDVSVSGVASAVTPNSLVMALGDTREGKSIPAVFSSWEVKDKALRSTNLLTDNSAIISDSVVVLRAQYGVTETGGNTFSRWTDATDDFATLTAANISRVRYVRVAFVTRNAYAQSAQERDGSTTCTATTVKDVPIQGWFDNTNTQITADVSSVPNWECYTYRAYTHTIPIRNFSWGLAS